MIWAAHSVNESKVVRWRAADAANLGGDGGLPGLVRSYAFSLELPVTLQGYRV
jgi:hypothetical protein